MKLNIENTSGFKTEEYYWFDLPSGWAIGLIVACTLYGNGVAVLFCGSDELTPLPFCYTERIQKPED